MDGELLRGSATHLTCACLASLPPDFLRASALLLDSIATFTATEVYPYETFAFYAVLMGLKVGWRWSCFVASGFVGRQPSRHAPGAREDYCTHGAAPLLPRAQCLDRATLKKSIIDSPDILTVIDTVPYLGALLNSFYEGRYADFLHVRVGAAGPVGALPPTLPLLLQALVDIYPSIAKDAFLHAHVAYYVREMRLAAYTQFLESYKRCGHDAGRQAHGCLVAHCCSARPRFAAA